MHRNGHTKDVNGEVADLDDAPFCRCRPLEDHRAVAWLDRDTVSFDKRAGRSAGNSKLMKLIGTTVNYENRLVLEYLPSKHLSGRV